MKGDIIEADFYPEDGDEKGHISLNLKTDEMTSVSAAGYGKTYDAMACCGLKSIRDSLAAGKTVKLPETYTVMWY